MPEFQKYSISKFIVLSQSTHYDNPKFNRTEYRVINNFPKIQNNTDIYDNYIKFIIINYITQSFSSILIISIVLIISET